MQIISLQKMVYIVGPLLSSKKIINAMDSFLITCYDSFGDHSLSGRQLNCWTSKRVYIYSFPTMYTSKIGSSFAEFELFNVVWARLRIKDAFWPGIIIDGEHVNQNNTKTEHFWIYWIGANTISEIPTKQISHFVEDFAKIYDDNLIKADIKAWQAVIECIDIIRDFLNCNMSDASDLINWAKEGCVTSKLKHSRIKINELPQKIKMAINKIKDKNSLFIIDKESKTNPTAAQLDKLAQLKVGTRDLNSICISCVEDFKIHELHDHPYFICKVCIKCQEKLKSIHYCRGDDDVYYYCFICACSGEVFYCDNPSCRRTFCKVCIQSLCKRGAEQFIENQNPWNCFLCQINKTGKHCTYNSLLRPRTNWQEMIRRSITVKSPYIIGSISNYYIDIPYRTRGIRVLSLFDGIGTAMHVLKYKLNINVEVYYSSEVDPDALKLLKELYGSEIVHLGNISNMSIAEIRQLLPIDLLIGGSPCDELSLANPFRKGLYDIDGTGPLFFDFYKILKTIEEQKVPFFWLFENVASITLDTKAIINRFLQCEPTMIDAADISPQHRRRFFWGNLPTLTRDIPQKVDFLQNHLKYGRRATMETINCITTNKNSLVQGTSKTFHVLMNEVGCELYITELESIFGFPPHYTDVANLPIENRHRLLGRAWSAQVIEYLLKFLREYYGNP